MKACPPRKVAQNHTITVFPVIPNPGFIFPVIPNPGFTGVKDLFPERDQNRFFSRLCRIRNDMQMIDMPLDVRH